MKAAPPVDARELRALGRKFGTPELAELNLDQWPMPRAARGDRRGEVVFAIRNRRGKILLHTKSFYPKGVYRLPGGGIHWDEAVEEALFREVEEETGLPVTVDRFVGLILYAVRRRPRPFASYVFLLSTDKLHPRVHGPERAHQWLQRSVANRAARCHTAAARALRRLARLGKVSRAGSRTSLSPTRLTTSRSSASLGSDHSYMRRARPEGGSFYECSGGASDAWSV